MRGHAHLMGTYVEGESPIHRTPLAAKAMALLAMGILTLALPGAPGRSILLGIAVLVHLLAGLPPEKLWRPLRAMWLFLIVIIAYQYWINGPATAWAIIAGMMACIYAANILTATTPVQVLLDGVVAATSPLQRFGADPERFALTISLMLRSIPFILGAFNDVRDAAMARGLERSARARVLPVVVGTVAYARQTGDALAARGLGEKSGPPFSGGPLSHTTK